MKKIAYVFKRLGAEYKVMHKPDRKTLVIDTTRIMGTAIVAGAVLRAVDFGFSTLLGLLVG